MKARRADQSRFGILRRSAFTLVELLVVVAIIGLLLATTVPAIRNIIYTSTGSLAESQLRFGLGAARDLAIRNASADSAAVFTFEPGGSVYIVPMIHVGRILDTADPQQPLNSTSTTVYRDVFAPSALAERTQLPAGWMVRGFAPPWSIYGAGQKNNKGVDVPSNGWYYETNPAGNRRMNAPGVSNGLDSISGTDNRGNWVFPETAFYDSSKTDDGSSGSRPNSRSTFMVRFQKGTGRIVGAGGTPAVVLLPRTSIDSTQSSALASVQSPPWSGPADWRRVDRSDNLTTWARAITHVSNPNDASRLIGCRSTDVALAGTISILALYDESRMAAAMGARGLNKLTGSIYGGAVSSTGTGGTSTAIEPLKAPNIDLSLFPSGSKAATNAEFVQTMINNYMIGALKYSDVDSGAPATAITPDARMFTFDTYLGTVMEVK